MTYEPLNRRLSTLAAVFAFLGVALGVIALATNYWSIRTVIREVNNGTVAVQQPVEEWNVCSLLLKNKILSRTFIYFYVCIYLGSLQYMSNWCFMFHKLLRSFIRSFALGSLILISWWYFIST